MKAEWIQLLSQQLEKFEKTITITLYNGTSFCEFVFHPRF